MFLERLLSLCLQNKTDISNVLRALNLSTSKGTAWRKGSIPNGDILLKLAQYFNTTTDYLLGNTDDPIPASRSSPASASENAVPFQLTEPARELLDIFLGLDETAQIGLLQYARFLSTKKADAPMPTESNLA